MAKSRESWKNPRKWTMKKAMAVKLPELLKMSLAERADLAQYFQSAYSRRLKDANKAGVMPYGIHKFQKDMEIMKQTYGVDLSNRVVSGVKEHRLSPKWRNVPYVGNVLTAYISNMQDFFTWKTNTVAGWNKLKIKESTELFGWHYEKNAKGKKVRVPNYVMTDEERGKFWEVYHELIKRETNTIVQSDPGARTHYRGIKESGLSKYWSELAESEDIGGMSTIRLIEIMEASMNNNKMTFPEHLESSSNDDGSPDPFSDKGGNAGNNDFWGRNIDENFHLIE